MDDNAIRYLLAARFRLYLLKASPLQAKDDLSNRDMLWAFHSESQERLLDACSALYSDRMHWKDARALGIGLWVQKMDVLQRFIEKIARNQFMYPSGSACNAGRQTLYSLKLIYQ